MSLMSIISFVNRAIRVYNTPDYKFSVEQINILVYLSMIFTLFSFLCLFLVIIKALGGNNVKKNKLKRLRSILLISILLLASSFIIVENDITYLSSNKVKYPAIKLFISEIESFYSLIIFKTFFLAILFFDI